MKRFFTRKLLIISAVIVALAVSAGGLVIVLISNSGKSKNIIVKSPSLLEASPLSSLGDDYRQVGENDVYTMWLKPSNGNFYLENKTTKTRWYANPENALEDEYAVNVYKMELASSMILYLYDLENNQIIKKNTETACVRKKGVKLYTVENGFRADYHLSEEGVTVPVEVTLKTDHLEVRIVTDAITEENPEKFLLRSVKLLPNFGAAGKNDTGYVMMPDGSGALMHFNNGKYMMEDYFADVYGKDKASTLLFKPTQTETVSLPVFGIQKNDSAFLCVISSGDTSACLYAYANKRYSTYGGAYTEFLLRTDDNYMLDYQSTTAQSIMLFQERQMETVLCEQQYYFLEGENANYSGMAKRYRQYLMEVQHLKPVLSTDRALLLDFYVAVQRRDPVAGVPVKNTKTLSRISDVADYYNRLKTDIAGGISLRLLSWTKDEISKKSDTGAELVPGAGRWSDLEELNRRLVSNGDQLSLGIDLVSFTRSGNGISTYSDAAKALSNSPAYQYRFLEGTKMRDDSADRGYLLCPDRLAYVTERLLESLKSRDVSALSPYTIANNIYGSYGNTLITKEQTKLAYIETLEKLNKKYELVLDCAAGYAVAYADYVANVPMSASGFDLMDDEIPFYQMVFSGLRSYTTVPINLESDSHMQLLKAIETGSVLHYALITGNTENLINTELNQLYSVSAYAWKDSIIKTVEEWKKAQTFTEGSALVKHAILKKDVACSEFENGTKIIVNFGTQSYDSAYGNVPPRSYLVKGSDE